MPSNNPPSSESLKALEEAKEILETSSQTNKSLFAFIAVLLTLLISCISTTDKDLLLGTSFKNLPPLNIDLSIWLFASIAPLIVVSLHFYLLQNLSEHCEKLIVWCNCWLDVHPSRKDDMPQQLHSSWFDSVWLHTNHTSSTAIHTRLLSGICWLLYCWAAYTVLVIFFIRFAELQHYGYISWHLLLLVLDSLVLYWYWPNFTPHPKPFWWRTLVAIAFAPLWFIPYIGQKLQIWVKLPKLQQLLLFVINLWAFLTLVLIILIGSHTAPNNIKKLIRWENNVNLSFVPRLSLIGFIWKESDGQLDVSERRLIFADFGNADITNINLAGSDLQNAKLWNTKLQNAILASANLQNACLVNSKLKNANLTSVILQGADLRLADFQNTECNNNLPMRVCVFETDITAIAKNTNCNGKFVLYEHCPFDCT